MYRTLRPIRDAQTPTLCQMLSGSTDQSINQRLIRGGGNWIDTPLLGRLVGVVQIELVGELIQGRVKFGRGLSRSLCDVGKGLRSKPRRVSAQLCANIRGDLLEAKCGSHGQILIGEKLPKDVA